MTKVDLPCFIANGSTDITRWRFDSNEHVDAITNESIVFLHEQRAGLKNGSSIMKNDTSGPLDQLPRVRYS